MISNLYRSAVTPKFLFNKIKNLRSPSDLKFLLRAGKKLIGHLTDFS